MTQSALSDLLGEVGQVVDADAKSDLHRASVGALSLVLRRDCHGVLRKLEVAFPSDLREAMRERLQTNAWLTISAGELEILDIATVGKLYLLADRLSITFRMNVTREAIVDVISRCLAASAV